MSPEKKCPRCLRSRYISWQMTHTSIGLAQKFDCRLMWTILAVLASVSAITFYTFIENYSGPSPALEFCFDQTKFMVQVMFDYNKKGTAKERDSALFAQRLTTILGSLPIAIEIILYAVLFRSLKKQNQTLSQNKALSEETLRKR